MAGTPIIVNVTGGLQDQCGFSFNENDYIQIGSMHDKDNTVKNNMVSGLFRYGHQQ